MELAFCWKRALVLVLVAHAATAFVKPLKLPRPQQPTHATRSSSNEDTTPPWRLEVDDLIKAVSPWGSLVEAEIIGTDLAKQLPTIAGDVRDSVRRGTLLSEVVLGKGTEARFTVEGLAAVSRQLRQDILPKALEAAPRIIKAVPRPGTSTRTSPSASQRTGPMEGVAEALYSIKNEARGVTVGKIRQGLQTVAAETENIFSRTPSSLYSPEYLLEDKTGYFEVRRYASYAVCSAAMAADSEALDGIADVTDGSGDGFNVLAGYIFGNNTQEANMEMTTPVNIDVSPTGGRTMSFVMPEDVPAGEAPIPRDPRVSVNNVPSELLAVREFAGFATDGEIARQLDSLLWYIQTEKSTSPSSCSEDDGAWCAEDPSGKSYRLMQYNPPYTLPWQRTNAIAVRVYKSTQGDPASTSVQEAQGVRDEVSSTISQSSGSS